MMSYDDYFVLHFFSFVLAASFSFESSGRRYGLGRMLALRRDAFLFERRFTYGHRIV